MKISFLLTANNDTQQYDEQAAQAFALKGKLPCKDGDFSGLVNFTHEGQENFVVDDDLYQIMPSLVYALKQALKTGSGEFAISHYFQQYTITIKGDEAIVTDSTKPPEGSFTPRNYPKQQFTDELIDCAKRFKKFLLLFNEVNKEWEPAIDEIDKALAYFAQ